jgi:hypothetical protein
MGDVLELLFGGIRFLQRLGRLGALIAVAASAAMTWGGGFVFVRMGPWNELFWSPWLMLLGGVVALAGVICLFGSIRVAIVGVPPKRKLPTREEFLTAVRTVVWPAWVCVDCRLVVPPTGVCPVCGARSTCVEVRNDADFNLVDAAIVD